MQTEGLSPDEARCLIEYARRKYAEERWPLADALRPVRAAIAKLEPKPEPVAPPKPYVPSSIHRKKRR